MPNTDLLTLIEASHDAYARYEVASYKFLRAQALGLDRTEMRHRMDYALQDAKRKKKALLEYLGLA
jgi:ferritin-like metal-binding protein YciE